jgi:hypothetical protein
MTLETRKCLALAKIFIALAKLLEKRGRLEIDEMAPPITPKQIMKRQQRDRDRQTQIRNIQMSSAQKVSQLKQKLGT